MCQKLNFQEKGGAAMAVRVGNIDLRAVVLFRGSFVCVREHDHDTWQHPGRIVEPSQVSFDEEIERILMDQLGVEGRAKAWLTPHHQFIQDDNGGRVDHCLAALVELASEFFQGNLQHRTFRFHESMRFEGQMRALAMEAEKLYRALETLKRRGR